jgi:hypothetical protein
VNPLPVHPANEVTHIDDGEHELFPRLIHALAPEQWDEIELAHRAVEAVCAEAGPADQQAGGTS